MNILGISAYYHDSAAALIQGGRIVAAAQEERFSRLKHDQSFPKQSAAYCLAQAGLRLDQLDYVVFYEKPLLTFDRLLETYLAFAPRGFRSFSRSIPVWLKQKIFIKSLLQKGLERLDIGKAGAEKIVFSVHHHSHAASAFFPSPFERAAILVMDGVGEWATASLGHGDGTDIRLLSEIRFPHSLGLLYSAFTYYLGFEVNGGEYKVMGLAPYGEPKYVETILNNLIHLKEDGSFRLNMKYFNYCTGLTMTSRDFDLLFGGHPPRRPETAIERRHMDLARSVQAVLEQAILRLARTVKQLTGESHLCMAGGVALNCVANGKLLREKLFDEIWIQPASGDAGGAVGAALAVAHAQGQPRPHLWEGGDGMSGAQLGPGYGPEEIRKTLDGFGAVYQEMEDGALFTAAAEALEQGKAVGWFQGRMEFGPRALGNRSIMADARSGTAQELVNLKIKYRESFRPFAPAVLREDAGAYFDLDVESPYMLFTAGLQSERRIEMPADLASSPILDRVKFPRSDIPAVTHVDYSARVQTVSPRSNPRFARLLQEFKRRTGCSVLVNTSFNVRDEPIVCTPEDAYRCFMGTEMDALVIGNAILFKEKQ